MFSVLSLLFTQTRLASVRQATCRVKILGSNMTYQPLRKSAPIIAVCMVLLSFMSAHAKTADSVQKDNELSTMLFPLRSTNLEKENLVFLNELLAEAFAKHSPHQVLSSQDIEAMVEQQVQQQILGCVDESCSKQVASLVGARYIIHGSIHAMGESFHVLLTLIDTQENKTVSRSRATGLNHHKKHADTLGRAVRRLHDLEDADSNLDELIHAPVVSGSRVYESSLMAPAWNITLTGRELRERGYMELSEIFNDLPGIDVVRPEGASWLRTYWRGRRDTWQDHFLFLVECNL